MLAFVQIGFGSGLQSGVMFMLPHVLKTAFAAQRCGGLGFASLGDVWGDDDPSLFACAADAAGSGQPASVVALLLRLLPSAMLFQAGATCGEVRCFCPPCRCQGRPRVAHDTCHVAGRFTRVGSKARLTPVNCCLALASGVRRCAFRSHRTS